MNIRAERLQKISRDVERHGHSVTLVAGGPLPRYAYTIGLTDVIGFELIVPGAAFYTAKEVHRVANAFGAALRENPARLTLDVSPIGSFYLRVAHDSWTRSLALGALDFYGVQGIPGMQIVPDADHLTIDVPNMASDRSLIGDPVWQWLDKPWEFPVPPRSAATTNMAALQGAPITELARWGETEWEMFAGSGPDVQPDDVRTVPLATLMGHDHSLSVVLEAGIGSGYWRDEGTADWHEWTQRQL